MKKEEKSKSKPVNNLNENPKLLTAVHQEALTLAVRSARWSVRRSGFTFSSFRRQCLKCSIKEENESQRVFASLIFDYPIFDMSHSARASLDIIIGMEAAIT
jgi:hypothetical protein